MTDPKVIAAKTLAGYPPTPEELRVLASWALRDDAEPKCAVCDTADESWAEPPFSWHTPVRHSAPGAGYTSPGATSGSYPKAPEPLCETCEMSESELRAQSNAFWWDIYQAAEKRGEGI